MANGVDRQFRMAGQAHHLGVAGTGGHHRVAVLVATHPHIDEGWAGMGQGFGQLGVQLVFRGARFQGLTPEGQRVLDWALRIVGDTRTMREEMRALRTEALLAATAVGTGRSSN